MSNDTQFARLFKLQASVGKLVLDGKRDPEKIANIFQAIIDGSTVSSFDKKLDTFPNPLVYILEPVSRVMVPATTGKLVAKEKFVPDTGRKAKVKISYLGDNFTAWFLNGDGKTEDPISEQTLRYHKLRKSSVDGPIITELGGEAKAETTLSEMFSLMEKQKHGEDGVLLNNGYANIFYIKDQNGVLRSVYVYWDVVGWGVFAYSVVRPDRWRGGCQVFSRNSVLESSEPSA